MTEEKEQMIKQAFDKAFNKNFGEDKEIKYNKDEKWVPYKQLAETPQQTITRLEQENKELKEENVKLLFEKGALIKLCDNLTKIIDEKKEKESKLWQALEGIKNMLPEECFNQNQCNFCPHHNADLCTCNIAKKIREVLQ